MQTAEANTVSDSAEREESRIFGNIIVLINCGTLAFPLARKIMTDKHIELMEKIISFLKLPFKCYMAWCGGERRLDARIAIKRQEQAARLRAQFGHTELSAAPDVQEEPATSSPAQCKNTTVNADVPIFPAPIVVSGDLSGIYFKDTALSVDLVLLQDVDDKKEATAGSRRSSLEAAMTESKAELGANRVDYPPLQDQWYCDFARLQEHLKSHRVSSKTASARAREEEFG